MKYKDYLIIPSILMFLIYASCAYVAKTGAEAAGVPDPSVNPHEISWGCDDGGTGELWYSEEHGDTSYFAVNRTADGRELVSVYNGTGKFTDEEVSGLSYTVKDRHMMFSTGEKKYDIIFPNEMTAYDTASDTYYRRGDYSRISETLTSGKFINRDNANDWYVFKDTGKSIEYFGDKAFPGVWNMATADSISVYDKRCGENFTFNLICDVLGEVKGFDFDGVEYYLQT